MRVLVFNSKGGCGKSLIAREVIAAPQAESMIIVEIDTLNTTQLVYKKDFKDVLRFTGMAGHRIDGTVRARETANHDH